MVTNELTKSFNSSKLFIDSWIIAYRRKHSNIISDKTSPFTVIENIANCWAADPFLIEVEGKSYVFAELYDYTRGKGVIGYYELDNSEKKWKIAINEPYHLSYPHIYQKGNDIYLMPEAIASQTLYCYRAISFPDKWEKLEPIRKNVRYADTTIFEWNNKELALAYRILENEHYDLILLDLDDQTRDKVIELTDIDLRRPGGEINSEKRVRVAQNCRDGYGKGLIFYRYNIDEDGMYTEEEIGRLFPEQLTLSQNVYLEGLHTYNMSEHYEVIDIKTRTFNPVQFTLRVKDKLKRMVAK